MNQKIQLCLDGEWLLYYYPDEDAQLYSALFTNGEQPAALWPEPIIAQVPGTYELDLQRAGIISDPYEGTEILSLEKYEYYHFVYVRNFVYDRVPCGREWFRFGGVDTYATMYLNGINIGHTENGLIEHELPATFLRCGNNRLVVHIEPTVLRARENSYTSLNLALKYNYDSLYVRKAASMFGWDILPRMVSGGLWRSVKLFVKEPIGFKQVYIYTEDILSENQASLRLFYEVELQREPAAKFSVEVEGICDKSSFSYHSRVWGKCAKERINVENPQLWWPRGYGKQPLYEVTIRLKRDEVIIDEQHMRIGIRIVRLLRTSVVEDNDQGDFCFEINGKRIFVLGTNWTPPDAHLSLGDKRIPDVLHLIEDIGCNAIRVWGGGRYEPDEFYDFCDEKGIMVWQDFMMSCGNYPQNSAFRESLEQEVTWVVRRFRHHPSICLWAGDNENDQNYMWHVNFTDPNDNVITRDWIRQLLLNEDYTRPYLPSSPYLDEECYQRGIEWASENHLWGDRKYYKSDFYRNAKALFASEMGYHGCPSPSSIYRFLPEPAYPNWNTEAWLLHATSPDPKEGEPFAYRNDLMADQVRVLFGKIPEQLEYFALSSQISQAEAMQFFIQHFRSRKGRCTGVIWWNICDAWPQFSDAVVDYYGTKKLAYSFIRRCQQPICLMLEERKNGVLELIGVNDTLCEQIVQYAVIDVYGHTVTEGVEYLPNDRAVILKSILAPKEQYLWKIQWKSAEYVGENSYLTGIPPYSLEEYVRQAKALGILDIEGFEI